LIQETEYRKEQQRRQSIVEQVASTPQEEKVEKQEVTLEQEIAETEAQRFSDNSGKILAVYVPHRAVEISENMYDEMYLAALRVFLKSIEAYGAYAIVVPISDCGAERLTQAMCHTARRIKDCASVIGFALPDALTESEATTFTDAMSAKHAHYVYFSNRYAGSSFVTYAVESGRGQS